MLVRRLTRAVLAMLLGVFIVAGAFHPLAADALPASYGLCKSNASTTTCVKVIKRISTTFHQTGADGEDNATREKHQLTCEIGRTSSYSWGVSASGGVEASAWIFAKVSAQIGTHFDKTEGSESHVSTTMPVPPHTTVHCLRGTEVQTWQVRRCVYTSHSSACTAFTWRAPQGLIWRTTEHRD